MQRTESSSLLARARSLLLRLTRRSDGSALIETALVLLVGVPLSMYTFEICMMTYTNSVLGDAARRGVRYASLHGTDSTTCSGPSTGCGDPNGNNVVSYVKSAAVISLHDVSAMTVSVTWPDGASTPNSHVLIKIAYTYVPYVTYPGLSRKLAATAEGIIVY